MKKPSIAVIDYGMGNLRSVAKALEMVGASVTVTDAARTVAAADAVVFPGVGSFGPAIRNIRRLKLNDVLTGTIDAGKPFLGLCLGFQLLFTRSEEEGDHPGLNAVAGNVVKFDTTRAGMRALKVPHMGWNQVSVAKTPGAAKMFKGIADNSYFYFVHSYYGVPKQRKASAGMTEYGVRFCSAIAQGQVWACQFHPEKSGEQGLRLLRNFVKEVTVCS